MEMAHLPAARTPALGALLRGSHRPRSAGHRLLACEADRYDVAVVGDEIQHLGALVPTGVLECRVVLRVKHLRGALDAGFGGLIEGDRFDGAVRTERRETVRRLREDQSAARDADGADGL